MSATKEANGSFLDYLQGFNAVNALKHIRRYSGRTFRGREESSAEHSWCCLVVAKFLCLILEQLCPGKYALNMERVYELLTFHDLLEAYTCMDGYDVDANPPDAGRQLTKEIDEANALPVFLTMIPEIIGPSYESLIVEYNAKKTLESQFAHLVDCVEAEIRVFDMPEMFKLWTEAYFIDKRKKYFTPFPELEKYVFESVLQHHCENGYFSQAKEISVE